MIYALLAVLALPMIVKIKNVREEKKAEYHMGQIEIRNLTKRYIAADREAFPAENLKEVIRRA